MALIRGHRGKCPCPICLVPNTALSDLHTRWPERDPDKIQAILRLNSPEKEEILQAQGLRPITVRF